MGRLKEKLGTGEAFRRVAHGCLAQVAEFEAGAIRRDAESLHKMRVGVRRLRSVFTTFKPGLIPEKVSELRAELHWFQGVLGKCRDWDVFNAQNVFPLRDRLADEAPLQRVAGLAATARERAYDTLDHAAGTKRHIDIYDHLRALLDDPRSVGNKWMRRPIGRFARRALKKRTKKLHLSLEDIAHMELGEMHELRKQIKKARYAISFFADLYPAKRASRHLKQLSLMQDLIGQMVDIRAGQALIEELRPENAGDRAALVASRHILLGWMTANSSDCRRRLLKAWDRYQSLKPLR